jgi:histidine kinase
MIVTGYKIDQVFASHNHFHLGISSDSSRPVPLKVKYAIRDEISVERLLHLKNNFSILSTLDHTLLPKAIDFRTDKEHIALITDFIPGSSIQKLTETGPLPTSLALSVALDLSQILGYLYEKNIIHQSLSPGNVILGDDKRAYLINFDKATNQDELAQEKVPIKLLPYELHCCAPEQTGRVNRLIDYRTDFYGLGIILYVMLTGQKPFDSDDPLELVHAQVAKMPQPVSQVNKKVPAVIDQIVSKLLAKNAEDRYQSAAGLAADLTQCLELLDNEEQISGLKLATEDLSSRFNIPQRLIGRDKELQIISDAYDAVLEGHSRLVMVSGYSGVGKSALIDEAEKLINEKGGLLIKGKCDQFQNIPYASLVEASTEFFNFIMKEDDHTIRKWKKRIVDGVGDNMALLTVGLPALEQIVGPQEKPEDLSPTDAENRFNQVVFNYLQAIASPEMPLVIFLDDLQWSDFATLDLIEKIVSRQTHKNLLFIGAYRDNEVHDGHAVLSIINKLREVPQGLIEIKLEPLGLGHVTELIAEIFYAPEKQVEELAQLIFNKTLGNPFFTIQLLRNLYDDNIVYFDTVKKVWNWNKNALSKMNISDNVVDLMVNKINTLPDKTKDFVCKASPIGSEFKLKVHSALCEVSESDIIHHLFPAIKEKVVHINSTWYPFMLQRNTTFDEKELAYLSNLSFSFIHDRVQQAAYSMISLKDRLHLHKMLGYALLNEYHQGGSNDLLYDIVFHLNKSYSLIVEPEKRLELIQLNLKAGQRSNRSNAFTNALEYLKKGIELLDDNSWNEHYQLAFDLHKEMAWAQSICRSIEETDLTFDKLIKHAKAPLDRLAINIQRVGLYTKYGLFEKVISVTRESLVEFGIKFPEKPLSLKLAAISSLLITTLKLKLRFSSWKLIEDLPASNDPTNIAINNILVEAGSASYSTSQELMVLTMLKVLNRSLKYGATESTPWSFQAYGVIAGSFFKWYKAGYEIGESSIILGERVCGNLQRARLPFVQTSFIAHWRQPLTKGLPVFLDAYKKTTAQGDLIMAYNCLVIHTNNLLGAGTPLPECAKSIEEKQSQMKGSQSIAGLFISSAQYQFVKALQGKTKALNSLNNAEFDEEEFLNSEKSSGNSRAYYISYKIQLCYYANDLENAPGLLNRFDEAIPFVIGLYHVNELEFFSCLLRFDLLKNAEGKDKNLLLTKIKGQLKTFKSWASNCPENFQHQYDLLRAELAAYRNNAHKAFEYYEAAIAGAEKNKFLQILAICQERAGNFYTQKNRHEVGQILIWNAWNTLQKWGASAIRDAFLKRYPDISFYREENPESAVISPLYSEKTTLGLEEILDLNSLLKASQSLSSALKYEDLLHNLMQILLENAAAQKIAFILNDEGTSKLAAIQEVNTAKAVLMDDELNTHPDLVPLQVINYCFNTKEVLVIENAGKNRLFAHDPYITTNNILSVMCFPIIYQNKLLGGIYLENNLMEGAFTRERIEVMNLLSTQIAVSLTNAQLYENMEEKVDARTKEIMEAKDEIEQQKQLIELEQEKSEKLLLNILPESIARELKLTGSAKAKHYDQVSVLFADVVGFTKIAARMSPAELVQELDYYFNAFDHITDQYGLEKIKTIGDAYMVAGGLTDEESNAAFDMIQCALEMQRFIEKERQERTKTDRLYFEVRFGIHTGEVVAGVVGHKKFAFDIWGDTVNTAARMQSHSDADRINISEATYLIVKDEIPCTYRGEIDTKHKGIVKMYFVEPIPSP